MDWDAVEHFFKALFAIPTMLESLWTLGVPAGAASEWLAVLLLAIGKLENMTPRPKFE